AIKGVVFAASGERNHVITAATEHRSVLDTCSYFSRAGLDVTVLPVDRFGLVDPEDVRRSITPKTILVSIMAANNEIGTVGAFDEIGRICHAHEVPYHTDATQAAGKIPLSAATADLLSLSAHKMYGPKGIGALVIRSGRPSVRLVPLFEGGGHERGLRSGTLNVPAIVGFGVAAELAVKEMAPESARISGLRDRLVGGLRETLDEVHVNGHPESRLPNNASLQFSGANADRVMMGMKDIAVSSGSACSSALPGPSHVLQAIGLNREESLCTIRFGLGRFTTAEEIEYAITRVADAVRRTRAAQNLAVMEHT
ncbi:MAG TPA: cysteine desulfurase family protein, partial [Bacteroidota bacterium]|nr:cysteine desulfurase family protein [Bacteroidota bacterium]